MLSHTGPAQASFLDLKRPDPASDKSFFLCLPLHTRPPSRPSPPPRKWKCLILPFPPRFNPHFSLFHVHVLQGLSSEGNSHLGTVTWSVRVWIHVGKVQWNWFSGRLIAQALSHKWVLWVPFPPVFPRLTEQGIFGTVILKFPIGSSCDGHQEKWKGWWENNLLCPLWERSLLSEKATCTSLTHSTNNSRHLQTWNLPAKWLSPEKNAFLPLGTVKNHKSTRWKSPFDAFRSAVILITSWRNYPKFTHAEEHSLFWFVFAHSGLCSEPLCTLWDLQGLGRN